MPFDLRIFLDHIGAPEIPRTAEGLFALQTAQLRAIPFENIDPLLGRVPDPDPDAVADKVIARGRGGYCYELNALLGAAMGALGFPVRRALARVRMGAAQGGPRSHLALLTEVDGRRYVADAGFGGPGALVPLALDMTGEQAAPNGIYRLTDDAVTGERVVERRTADGWFALYGFDEAWVGDADIASANYVSATWHKAPFRQNLMLAGYDGAVRHGLFNRAATQDSPAGQSRSRIDDVQDLSGILKDRLGIRLEPDAVQSVWERIADK